MDAMRNAIDDYAANMAAAASNSHCTCETKRPATICEIATKNSQIIIDINDGMNVLLAILTGSNGEEGCNPTKAPICLMEDISDQGVALGMIHAKVTRAIAALGK